VGKSGIVIAAGNRDGFLTRLRKDQRGNTIAMMAMGLLMLAGLGGSAVDVGRTYLVKTRLQQACDAGVLAGRRAMTTAAVDAPVITQATNFFNQNFGSGNAGATSVTFTPVAATGANAGQITASATATVPMSVMQLFGKTQIELTVNCDARLEVSNTDVMLVLDVTGSMANCPDDSNSCGGGAGSKIEGLRSAVLDFYDTVTAATSANARFRVGFVPYSSAVNVGTDVQTGAQILNADWLVDSWSYQSRVANMNTSVVKTWSTEGAPTNPSTEIRVDGNGDQVSISAAECAAWGTNYGDLPDVVSGTAPNVVASAYRNNNAAGADWGFPGASDVNGNNRSCRRYLGNRSYTGATLAFGFTNWTYQPVTVNVSNYKTGTAINAYTSSLPPKAYSVSTAGSWNMIDLPNAPGSTMPTSVLTALTFNGCVEERDTVAQATYGTVPAGAYDLDVVTTPTSSNPLTKWRPSMTAFMYDRSTVAAETTASNYDSPSAWCPPAASKLSPRTRAEVQTFVNTLTPNGYTYHDLGMAWGVRLLAPTGLFASENTTAPNGRPISRHILFMTDGMMVTPDDISTPHGYEKIDRRVSGGATPDYNELVSRHNERFQALCNAARNNNITVWTIAFGTSNPSTLVSCADPGRAFSATDTATLRANFQQIASQIAELRLSR
jgi:Flp pilus assembly protein TadG